MSPRTTTRAGPILAVLVAALGVVLLAPSGAQCKKKDKAVQLYQQAVELAQQEKYELAIGLFEEALAEGAPPLTYYNIARCHESLGDLESAVDNYRKYLAAPDATDVDEVGAIIESLLATPSEVVFTTDPEGASVSEKGEDGATEDLGTTPLTITADKGTHTYVVDLEGHEPQEVTVEAGLGKKRNVELTLEKKAVVEVPEVPEEPKGEPLGLAIELGGGMALHIAKGIVQPGGEASLGIGWRFAPGTDSGFAIGLRVGIRPFSLDATLVSGQKTSYSGLFATILAVPAYQIRIGERLGLELTLPVGLAVLDATDTVPSTAVVKLVGGTIEGGGLVLFDVGVGASLRIVLYRGLYIAIEPVRLQLLVPLTRWLSDTKIVTDVDFTVRLGWQF